MELFPTRKPKPTRLREPEQTIRWFLEMQGELTRLKAMANYRRSTFLPVRGPVGEFSRAARWRMLQALARVDWVGMGPALFVTLTYPDGLADRTYKRRTQDKYLFHRYVEKYLDCRTPMLWRCEWIERKTGPLTGYRLPHFHFVLWTKEYLPWQQVREWWGTILGYTGPLATDVRRVRGSMNVGKYAAKYAAKSASPSLDYAAYLNTSFGRHWGWTREHLVKKMSRTWDGPIDPSLAAAMRTWLAEAFNDQPGAADCSQTVLGFTGKKIGHKIRKMFLDGEVPNE